MLAKIELRDMQVSPTMEKIPPPFFGGRGVAQNESIHLDMCTMSYIALLFLGHIFNLGGSGKVMGGVLK